VVKRWLVVVFFSLLLSVAFPTRPRAEDTADEKSNNVMALHLEIVTTHEDAELRDFKDRFSKVLWRNWFAVMPEDAQLGAAGVVIVRFQIQRDRSQSAEPPVVEQSPGEKLKSLTKSALSAIRDSTKSMHLPDGFTHSNIELRATFYYNQPAETVKR
jgi:hypothetical protein